MFVLPVVKLLFILPILVLKLPPPGNLLCFPLGTFPLGSCDCLSSPQNTLGMGGGVCVWLCLPQLVAPGEKEGAGGLFIE